MGRRKKEPIEVHRTNIASAAQDLFMQKGIEAVSMDDIAKAAAYSKATLYVYFENKDEIVSVLVLESMKKLHSYIADALNSQMETKECFHLICHALLQYQEEFPFYFKMVLDKINIDFDKESSLLEDKETFHIGEEINRELEQFITTGVDRGELRDDLKILPTIFSFWGMISGLIQTAANKEEYIEQEMKLSKYEFLEYGFDTLYRSLRA